MTLGRDEEIVRYGQVFPAHASDVSIELKCYAMGLTPEQGGLGAAGHMKRAIQMLYPEYDPCHVVHPREYACLALSKAAGDRVNSARLEAASPGGYRRIGFKAAE